MSWPRFVRLRLPARLPLPARPAPQVTPSSKVVGDLAQFMVSNNLDEHSLVEQAESLSLPSRWAAWPKGYWADPGRFCAGHTVRSGSA